MADLPTIVEPATPGPAPTRQPRPGELTRAWTIMLAVTWIGAFVAYMAVWKTSEELGLATWWLGPRSNPQPLVVRLIPFVVTATGAALMGTHLTRLPWISLGGAGLLAAIAAGDVSRSGGIAAIEFTIAGAVAIVSLASLTGTYRAAAAATDATTDR